MNKLLDMIPWPAVIFALAAFSGGLYLGSSHVQKAWDAEKTARAVAVSAQAATQSEKTKERSSEAAALVARSDNFYRLRLGSGDAVRAVSGTPRESDEAAPANESDPARNSERTECSLADGAADAITLIELQQWIKSMGEK